MSEVVIAIVLPVSAAIAGLLVALLERNNRQMQEQSAEVRSDIRRLDDRVTTFDRRVGEQFTGLERHMNVRFDGVTSRIDALYQRPA